MLLDFLSPRNEKVEILRNQAFIHFFCILCVLTLGQYCIQLWNQDENNIPAFKNHTVWWREGQLSNWLECETDSKGVEEK